MGRRRVLALALVVVAGGPADYGCRGGQGTGESGRCEAPLVVVNEPMGADVESLPVVAELEDIGPPARGVSGCGEYGREDEHRAKLGPLTARYTSTDYKGQSISTNTTLSLSSPACPRSAVAFTMAAPSFVRLRRDPARDVYIVTGGILDNRAIAVRIGSPAK
jgi:hypothetical protein